MKYRSPKQFRSYPQEESGVWFQLGDARFLVASFSSRAYRVRLQELMTPIMRAKRGQVATIDDTDPAETQAIAEKLLLNWENLTEDGAPVVYSPKAAQEMLARYPKFRDVVRQWASEEAAFKAAQDAAGIDNLKKD